MTTLRFRRRTAAWLALAAMALNSAWPLVANARPADPTAEICSSTGLKHAAGGAPEKDLHASHCTLCPFGAERGAVIAPALAPLPVAVPAPAPVVERGDAPRVQLALYPAAPPRAPPVLS